MKLTGKAIGDFVQRPKQARGVLIYGPDGGLARDRMQQITKAIVEAGDPFGVQELGDDQLKADPARLADECAASSLLGGNRVIIVRDAGDKLAKTVEQALPLQAPQNYLIVMAEELSPRSALRALFEQQPSLAALPCYKDEAQDIGAVIRQRLDGAGIRYARDVADYLLAHLGNDRYITYSELEKIILYVGDTKQLTLEAAQALVGHNRDVGLDQIAGALADRNAPALDAALTQAWREAVQPIAVVRACLRYFHRLLNVRAEVDGGKPVDAAVSAVRPPLFFRQVPIFTRQVQQWRTPQVMAALSALNAAELQLKQGLGSPNVLLGQVLLGLCERNPKVAA